MSNLELMTTWSLPRVTTYEVNSSTTSTRTSGQTQFLVRLIGNRSAATGLISSMLQYTSSGEMVPDVITIERYFLSTGFNANEASKQLHR